jgi:hypothetical protein
MVVTMKIVFLVVMPCNLVDVIDISEECAVSIFCLKMEAVCSSETSVNIYQSTLCHIPGDNNFHNLNGTAVAVLLL